MLFYIGLFLYLTILMVVIIKLLLFVFLKKTNMIYLLNQYLFLPIFLIIVSCVISFLGLRESQVIHYDSSTLIISILISFITLLIGAIFVYIITSWRIVFFENKLLYFHGFNKTKLISFDDIIYIDAFKPSSNGKIFICHKDGVVKINHNHITGNMSHLASLISKYRK